MQDPETDDIIDRALKIVGTRVKKALIKRASRGDLAPVTHLDDYRFALLTAWNRMVLEGVDALEDWELDEIVTPIQHVFFKAVFSDVYDIEEKLTKGKMDEATALAKIKNLVKRAVKKGSVSPRCFTDIQSPVFSGTMYLSLQDWVPVFTRFNPEYDRNEPGSKPIIPLLPASLPPVTVTSIDLPSGHLIIADTIRIEEFTKTARSDTFLINFAEERIKRSLHALGTHNLIEVACIGNDPALIVDRDGEQITRLRAGQFPRDPETGEDYPSDLEQVGDVDTDYWGVTMIDKADLMRILRDAGNPDPEAAFAEWRADIWGQGATEIHIPAGRWQMSFVDVRVTPGVGSLEKACPALGEGLETLLCLSREPLSFDPDLTHQA
jgi:hypothetical protein